MVQVSESKASLNVQDGLSLSCFQSLVKARSIEFLTHLTPERSEPLTFGHVCRICHRLVYFSFGFVMPCFFFQFIEFSRQVQSSPGRFDSGQHSLLIGSFLKRTISSIPRRIRRVDLFAMFTNMTKLRMQLYSDK